MKRGKIIIGAVIICLLVFGGYVAFEIIMASAFHISAISNIYVADISINNFNVQTEDVELQTENMIQELYENVDSMEANSEIVFQDGNGVESEWDGLERMDSIMYAQNSVNIRSGPGTEYDKTGRLELNDEIIVLGQHKESGWYYIEYDEERGYVSDKYLCDNKVVIQAQPISQTESLSQSQTEKETVTTDNTHSIANGDMWTADDIMNALEFNHIWNND